MSSCGSFSVTYATKESRCTISGWLNPFDMKSRTKTLFQILLQSDSRPRHKVSVLIPFDSTQATQTTGYLLCPFSQISLLRVVGLLKHVLFLATQSSYSISSNILLSYLGRVNSLFLCKHTITHQPRLQLISLLPDQS